MTAIRITRAGPLCTVQDAGRIGMLRHGVSASGPMDRASFTRAASWMGGAGSAGIEITMAGMSFVVEGGPVGAGFDGGDFSLTVNGVAKTWPARVMLKGGDAVNVTPGARGNYGYIRFDRELTIPPVMGSRATNSIAGLGGFEGRSLAPGDRLEFGDEVERRGGYRPRAVAPVGGPIRIVWGLHADLFDASTRDRFVSEVFAISRRTDRMGARLEDRAGVFAAAPSLSLVSDAIVPGDIQILGDGTPIVLLRDHQPTGGYPRIATVISADFDLFVQFRPGSAVRFEAVSVERAQTLLASGGA